MQDLNHTLTGADPADAVEENAPEELSTGEGESDGTVAEAPTEITADGAESTAEGAEDVFIAEAVSDSPADADPQSRIKAIIEAAIYITDEPLSAEQIAAAIERPLDLVMDILDRLVAEYAAPDRGLSIREIAGGYKLATKPEHHEAVRRFVKNLQPPLKLSLAALETLAVVAYKQPITAPEIMDIRGVQGVGVLSTLLARKLIAHAGRKNVLGKPILYKTTREFLVQFGLNSLSELPTLKEFEDLGRLALTDSDEFSRSGEAETETAAGPEPETAAPDA